MVMQYTLQSIVHTGKSVVNTLKGIEQTLLHSE